MAYLIKPFSSWCSPYRIHLLSSSSLVTIDIPCYYRQKILWCDANDKSKKYIISVNVPHGSAQSFIFWSWERLAVHYVYEIVLVAFWWWSQSNQYYKSLVRKRLMREKRKGSSSTILKKLTLPLELGIISPPLDHSPRFANGGRPKTAKTVCYRVGGHGAFLFSKLFHY